MNDYERKVDIEVNEKELVMIIKSLFSSCFARLIDELKLKEKLSELKRYNNPKERS